MRGKKIHHEYDPYIDPARELGGLKAIQEGERSAKEIDSQRGGGSRIDYNPRILDTSPGARDRLLQYLDELERKHPELKDEEVVNLLAELREILSHYKAYDIDIKSGDESYVDAENPERQRRIMEILDNPKVEAVLRRSVEKEG